MAVVMAMMGLTLLTGLGTGLIVGTMTETQVAAVHRQALEVLYAAEAAMEFAIRDLAAHPDWDAVLTGDESSVLADGPPDGARRIGARPINLTRATTEVDALLGALTAPRATRAQLYAYGPFQELLSIPDPPPPAYVCVWLAEFLRPLPEDPPVRLLYMVSRAYGAAGGQRTVLVTVARPLDADEPLQVRSWEEPR
jgi:hypothetical protein